MLNYLITNSRQLFNLSIVLRNKKFITSLETEIKMNIEQKILEQIWDTLMQNNKYPDHFNFATDLRYDHSINYNPDNPTISLVVEKAGRPTNYKISINEVKNEIIT